MKNTNKPKALKANIQCDAWELALIEMALRGYSREGRSELFNEHLDDLIRKVAMTEISKGV